MKRMTLLPALAAALLFSAPAWAGTTDFDAQMKPVLDSYLEIHTRLAADETDGVQASARKLVAAAAKLKPGSVTGTHAGHYDAVPKQLRDAGQKLAQADSLEAARAAFKELSGPMTMWAGMSQPKGVYVMYCSMAEGSWLQTSPEIRNPYYGSQMLACGEITSGGDQKKADHHGGHGPH